MATPPLPLDPGFIGHPERYAPALLLHRMGLVALTEGAATSYSLQARAAFRPDFSRWAHASSENWDAILAAALCWDGPEGLAMGLDPLVSLLRYQIGEAPAPPGIPELGFFGGAEVNSFYESLRFTAALALRKLAERYPKHPRSGEIMELTARYIAAELAIGRLFKAGPSKGLAIYRTNRVDQIDAPGHQHWAARDWWSVVGGRSDPASTYGNDLSAMLAVATGFPARGAWATTAPGVLIFGTLRNSGVSASPSADATALRGIRILVPIHVMTWPSGRLAFMERRPTNLTPCFFFDWYDAATGVSHLGFPWEGGRGADRAKDAGECSIVLDSGGRSAINARTAQGSATVPLPAGPPDTHLILGPDGLKKLR